MTKKTTNNRDFNLENLSKKKRFFFTIGTFLLVFGVIALAEVSLRLAGYGTGYPLFVDAGTQPGKVVMNPKVGGKYFFLSGNATTGFQEPFNKIKPTSTYRIFVLGASTGIGYPYRNNGWFHRWLQNGLDLTFPDINIEVINLSLTAINSYTLLDFARQLPGYDPDAVLIYAGHNEYYGALGVGASNVLSDSPAFVNVVLDLREYRLFQLVARAISNIKKALVPAPTDRESLMQHMVAEQSIPLGSDMYRVGIDQFEYNLQRMLETLHSAKIPTFISTLASNERGIRPFISDTTAPKNADYYFLLGQKKYNLADFGAAKKNFIEAKELDGLRFRAPQKMNDILREKANAFTGVHLVDAYATFEHASMHGILGNELLLEHVHPNLDGYALLGYSFYKALENNEQIAKNWSKALSEQDFRRQMPITEVDSLAGIYEVMMLREGWPFYEPIDKSQLKTSTIPQIISGQLAIKKYSWQQAMCELYRHYRQDGEDAKALRVLEALLLDRPQRENLYLEAGKLAVRLDSIPVADRLFGRLFRRNGSVENAQQIARAFIDAGALREALPFVEAIKKANPADKQAGRYIVAIKGILKTEAQTDKAEAINRSLTLAEYYRQLDQPQNSLPLVEKVLEQEPEDTRAVELKNKLQQR